MSWGSVLWPCFRSLIIFTPGGLGGVVISFEWWLPEPMLDPLSLLFFFCALWSYCYIISGVGVVSGTPHPAVWDPLLLSMSSGGLGGALADFAWHPRRENTLLVQGTSGRSHTFYTYTQCCGSGSVLDPYSGAYWIRIRNTDPDLQMQIEVKMEAKDVIFKILINNSETQLIKNFFMWQYVLIVKIYTVYLF